MSIRKLGDVASTIMGQAPLGTACNKEGRGTVFVKAGEFAERTPVIVEWTTNPLKFAQHGDVLVCVVGATAGKVNLAIDCAIGRSVAAVRPNPKLLDTAYLHYFLRGKTAELRARSQGLAQGVITRDMLEALTLSLPPIAEQRRIAAILDAADALRVKRRAALTKLDALAQAIFFEMFGEGTAVEQLPLASVCDLITDGTHYTPTYAESGILFLSAKNVTKRRIDWKNVKHIPESLHVELQRRVSPRINDVLLAKNGTTGVAALVDRDCVFDIYVSLALLRPGTKVLPKYLLEAVNSDQTRRKFDGSLKGIGVSNLHLVDIRAATIPVPSLVAQKTFVEKIECIEKLRTSAVLSLENSNHLFASLQHRAFRGELSTRDEAEIAA